MGTAYANRVGNTVSCTDMRLQGLCWAMLNEPEKAICNINMAMENNYPKESLFKLYHRRGKLRLSMQVCLLFVAVSLLDRTILWP